MDSQTKTAHESEASNVSNPVHQGRDVFMSNNDESMAVGDSNSMSSEAKTGGKEKTPAKGKREMSNVGGSTSAQGDNDHPLGARTETLIENAPPPAYSEAYGHINLAQNGLNTVATLKNDGRVNINISDESRLVSNMLVPALKNQLLKNQQQSQQQRARLSQVPPSLGGISGQASAPPPMNIVIHVVGSRGDVQPFVALGKVLKDNYGHRIRLATHPTFRDFVTDNGLEFFSIGGDPAELMAFMVKNPGLMPGKDAMRSGDIGRRRKGMYEIVQGCWRSCFEAGDGTGLAVSDDQPPENFDTSNRPFVADAIIANPPSFAHIHCAEKLGIPLHLMFTMPWSPTQSFPHPLADIQTSSTDVSITNFLSYVLVELMTWQGLGDVINRFREKSLGLEPLSLMWAPGLANRLRIPYTYCWSPALIPKPKDWGPHIDISGFYFLSLANNYEPPAELLEFINAGPPPIYIGFGSIVLDDPDAMTKLIFEAVERTGQRALISKGWGGFGVNDTNVPENIMMLGNVPHDWLFQHVSCIVHHGGAGTTAAGIALGKPTVIVPFFGDQPFWGAMIARAGAGPTPVPSKQLNAEKLANAILEALQPSTLERAKELGIRIASEKGTDVGAKSFHEHLEIEQMRCSLASDRAAVWETRIGGVRLSAFAAAVLGNEGLLDFNDLKLYRSKEYDSEDAPWDPIGGAASALAGTIGSLMMGGADIPTEVFSIFSNKSAKPKSPSEAAETSGSQNLDAADDAASATGLASSTSKDEKSLSDRGPDTSEVDPTTSTKTQIGEIANKTEPAVPSQETEKKKQITMENAIDASRGVGRIIDTGLKSPMDFTLALARGFHNAPKLYGDKTVRSVDKVTGLQSGLRAAGRGFGFGLYDGISGLVTQPLEGAKADGFSGLIKGFGKGIGGVVLKPSAAAWSVPGYTFQGIYKEIRKLFGSSVQNYIIAARTAQGMEEWARSTPEQRLRVVNAWTEMQSNLKGSRSYTKGKSATQSAGSKAHPAENLNLKAEAIDGESFEQAIKKSVEVTSTGNAEEDAMIERAIRASLVELQQRTLDAGNTTPPTAPHLPEGDRVPVEGSALPVSRNDETSDDNEAMRKAISDSIWHHQQEESRNKEDEALVESIKKQSLGGGDEGQM